MLQLNYKLTDEDYIEFNEFHQLIHSEVGKRNLFKLRLIGPMISILAIVIFILARAEIMLIVTEVIVLCIFSIVCVTQAKKVEDVCETEEAFYVYMSSVQAIIIPKRVLDQDKEKKLRQILSKK